MSIKIYHAVKIPANQLIAWQDWFVAECYKIILEEVEVLMTNVKQEDVNKRIEKLRANSKLTDEQFLAELPIIERRVRWEKVCEGMIEASVKCWNGYNPDCWCNIYPIKDYFLIIYEFPLLISNKKSLLPNWAKEWGYWNNTDKPEEVSEAEWLERDKDWQVAIEDSLRQKRRLSFSLVEAKNFQSNGLGIIESLLFKEKDGWEGIGYFSAWLTKEKEFTVVT